MCLLCELEPAGRRIIIIKLGRLEEKTLALEAPRPQRPHNTICRGVARRAGLLEQAHARDDVRAREVDSIPPLQRRDARVQFVLINGLDNPWQHNFPDNMRRRRARRPGLEDVALEFKFGIERVEPHRQRRGVAIRRARHVQGTPVPAI